MRLNIIEEGRNAWCEGKGFLDNPYPIMQEKDNYYAWAKGWWGKHYEEESISHRLYEEEKRKEIEEEKEKERIKEMKKTKKGRQELAGQITLF